MSIDYSLLNELCGVVLFQPDLAYVVVIQIKLRNSTVGYFGSPAGRKVEYKYLKKINIPNRHNMICNSDRRPKIRGEILPGVLATGRNLIGYRLAVSS